MKKITFLLAITMLLLGCGNKNHSGTYKGTAVATYSSYRVNEVSTVRKISKDRYSISFSNAVCETNVREGFFVFDAYADGHNVFGTGFFEGNKITIDMSISGRAIVFTGYK